MNENRARGAYFTANEVIHKVIDPLFMNELNEEFSHIGMDYDALCAFHEKIACITILEPACGNGNFIVETYKSLRRLENSVLKNSGRYKILVSPLQFYGIEINQQSVDEAKRRIIEARNEMLSETQSLLPCITEQSITENDLHIHCGNALRMDWNDVLPAEQCSYIIGNPPFVGFGWATSSQKDDLDYVLKKEIKHSKLDYVICWFAKAAEYLVGNNVAAALVATNSICQGEHVPVFWSWLLAKYPIEIDFAYKTFVWDSEATDKASVHCVILGFSEIHDGKKKIIFSKEPTLVKNISPYLFDAPSIVINKATSPICSVPPLYAGSQPSDGGNLILSPEERKDLLKCDPYSERFIKRFMMGYEFLNNIERYCLWIPECDMQELEQYHPLVYKRVQEVAKFRSKSSNKQIREKAAIPYRFDQFRPPTEHYLAFARVSAGRRIYMPVGYLDDSVIPGDKLYTIPDGDIYMFGILSSKSHAAWMRVVAGRLKSDYSYASQIVYNPYPWPNPTDEQRQRIVACAQAVLDVRDQYQGKSLADLYDHDKMPTKLRAAHHALDAAVDAAYGVDFGGDEEKIVSFLFDLYVKATQQQIEMEL